MAQRQLPVPSSGNGQVPVVINDIANIVLTSTNITAVVVAALTRALGSVAISGLKAVVLTFTEMYTEIELAIFDIRKQARIGKFKIIADQYNTALIAAENNTHYLPIVQQTILDALKDDLSRQMTRVLNEMA